MSLLKGLKVLDAGRILAAPLAGQMLGDMGADVIKIEPPAGDGTRAWGPPFQGEMSAYFQSVNRNKQSLVVDLTQEADQHQFDALLAKADVLIHNFLPRHQQRFGLTKETLQKQHPRLVTMGVSGYRAGGSRENEPGYDVMLQAESGIMSLIGPPYGDPYKVGVAWIDVLTGMTACNGILAALWRRERTGEGAFLNVSLYQTAVFSLINVGAAYHLTGETPVRHGNQHPTIVPYQLFQLRDRPLVIAVGNDQQYADLCTVLDLPLDHARNRDRVVHRDAVLARLNTRFAQLDAEWLLPRLKEARVPVSPVLSVPESFQKAAIWDPDAFYAIEHPTLGEIKTTAFPITGFPLPSQSPPPLPGEGGAEAARRWLSEES